MRFSDGGIDRTYPDDVFHVTGGRGSIHKAIKQAIESVKDALADTYEEAVIPGSLKNKHIYINNIKQDLTNFKDVKMFGTIL